MFEHSKDNIESQIGDILTESPAQLTTIPGVGDVAAAKLIGRIGPIARFKSADRLARNTGIAPEENSSGRIRCQGRSKYRARQTKCRYPSDCLETKSRLHETANPCAP